MFERIYAQKAARKDGVSLAETASRDGLTFAEAADQARQRGEITALDPRFALDPLRIKLLADTGRDELMKHYTSLLETRFRGAAARDERVLYAAALKSARAHEDQLRIPKAGQLAAATEKQAMTLFKANPQDPAVHELLTVSAALSDRGQRDRAVQGFETRDGLGNVAQAARAQGRSWIDVRDDLMKFGVMKSSDPRARIKPADIEWQKGGPIRPRQAISAVDTEAQAMARLFRNPRDEHGMSLLANAGAQLGPKEAQGILPAKPREPRFARRDLQNQM